MGGGLSQDEQQYLDEDDASSAAHAQSQADDAYRFEMATVLLQAGSRPLSADEQDWLARELRVLDLFQALREQLKPK